MHCDAQSVIAVISLIPRKGFVLRNKNYCIVLYCQPSVGREGTNRVRWPVSKTKKPMSTKSVFLTYVSLLFDYVQNNGLADTGL